MSEINSVRFNFRKHQDIFVHYILILTVGYLIAAAAAPVLWAENVYVVHTVLELICIYISASTFLIVWNAHEKALNINRIIGFGFLAVAVFDLFHTYYFFGVRVLNQGYPDLSTRYWILGRLTEALVLVTVSTKVKGLQSNKWLGLILTVIFSLGISITVIYNSKVLPIMSTDSGPTYIKIALEYVVIAITLLSLYNLRNNLDDSSIVSYRHIFIALLLIIPAELLFTLFKVVTSFYNTYGHVLKIAYYYFIYRAVFVSTILYPYDRLEIERRQLKKKNDEVMDLSETLNDLLGTLPIGILMYDMEDKLKYANKRLEELFECNKSDLLGLSSKEIRRMFSKNKGNEKTLYARTLENGKGIDRVIETFKTPSSNHIKLSLTSHKVKNGVLVLLSDVKKEQELQNLQLQTQTILNAIEKLVVIIDKDNKILMCNKAYEEIVGVSAMDAIGMDWHEHLSTFKAHVENEYEKDDERATKHRTCELSLTTTYGEVKSLLYSSSEIQNIDGEIIGRIGVASDITNLKEQQEKMLQQEKLALLGQMGAGIVHETRNYLTTIKGSCQLIDMLTQEESVRNYTAKISKNIDEVNRTISEFLSLSKTRQAELLEVSMYDIIQSIKGIVDTSSFMRSIDVDFDLSDEERYLMCDEGQIKQVVLNICKNAVDAMANVKDARLKIEAGYDEEKDELYIKISDNGYGISGDTLKKIGTPFFTTKDSGTGLGLSVCYKIIEEHHGRIEIKSQIGKGTTFIVTLPCIRDDEEFEEAT